MYTIFFRTVITYLLLIGAMRLMGKRQLGDLELSELVITMLLSELAAASISDASIPIFFSLIPITLLVAFEVFISFLSIKSRKIKKIISGSPSIVISKGKLCKSEMAKVRMSLDELLSQLRLKDISDVNDVEYAILEENGQISVIPKMHARNATLGDLDVVQPEKGIVHTIVADGQISQFNLRLTGHDETWLHRFLKKRGCKLSEVFLLSVDDAGNINLIKNGEVK